MKETAFRTENLGKAEQVRREMSSSDLRWSRVEAMERMQRKGCVGWGREAGSGREGERGLALLMTLMASSLQRERACGSWWKRSSMERGTL